MKQVTAQIGLSDKPITRDDDAKGYKPLSASTESYQCIPMRVFTKNKFIIASYLTHQKHKYETSHLSSRHGLHLSPISDTSAGLERKPSCLFGPLRYPYGCHTAATSRRLCKRRRRRTKTQTTSRKASQATSRKRSQATGRRNQKAIGSGSDWSLLSNLL